MQISFAKWRRIKFRRRHDDDDNVRACVSALHSTETMVEGRQGQAASGRGERKDSDASTAAAVNKIHSTVQSE